MSAAAGAACSSVIVSIMGSFQRHQERLARMREQMKVRKTVDIGKEVLTGKLRQKRLYDFMDEPAIEEKIDNILSLLVRKEKQLMAAETQLRRVQDSVSILTFFRALKNVSVFNSRASVSQQENGVINVQLLHHLQHQNTTIGCYKLNIEVMGCCRPQNGSARRRMVERGYVCIHEIEGFVVISTRFPCVVL